MVCLLWICARFPPSFFLSASRIRSVPCQTICDNAGLEGAVVVGKLLDHAKGKTNSSYGMNAATGEYLV